MRQGILIAAVIIGLSGCSTDLDENPLPLLIGAEPSAKSRNDLGIDHYKAGRFLEALLQFNQANFADPTSGEIHFNLGLAYLQEGKKKKARKNFNLAKKLARGNTRILKSKILNIILSEN